MVKCIVKIGSLQCEITDTKHPDGIFSQFDEFECTAERAALFDPHDVKVIPDGVKTVSIPIEETSKLEEKPLPQITKKTTTKKAPVAEEATATETAT